MVPVAIPVSGTDPNVRVLTATRVAQSFHVLAAKLLEEANLMDVVSPEQLMEICPNAINEMEVISCFLDMAKEEQRAAQDNMWIAPANAAAEAEELAEVLRVSQQEQERDRAEAVAQAAAEVQDAAAFGSEVIHPDSSNTASPSRKSIWRFPLSGRGRKYSRLPSLGAGQHQSDPFPASFNTSSSGPSEVAQ